MMPDIECRKCHREGSYSWGSCPYCGIRYPSRAPLPLSIRLVAVADMIEGTTMQPGNTPLEHRRVEAASAGKVADHLAAEEMRTLDK